MIIYYWINQYRNEWTKIQFKAAYYWYLEVEGTLKRLIEDSETYTLPIRDALYIDKSGLLSYTIVDNKSKRSNNKFSFKNIKKNYTENK